MRFPAYPVLAAVLAVAAGGSVRGADAPNPVGFPTKGDQGGGIGVVRVWYADGGWHLRTSTENSDGKRGKQMIFTGTVRCEDTLTVTAQKLEKVDKLVAHKDGKGFDFRFTTTGATDQADFAAGAKAKALKFNVMIDGAKADTSRVLIGAAGTHPAKSEFTLPARPKE